MPYGERRGGHLPRAIHLHYRELLDAEGRLRLESERLALLQERGTPRDAAILTYCTAGVRSAWLTAVLVGMGFDAKITPAPCGNGRWGRAIAILWGCQRRRTRADSGDRNCEGSICISRLA